MPRHHRLSPSPALNSKKTANGSKTSRKPGNPTSDPPQRGCPLLPEVRGHRAPAAPRHPVPGPRFPQGSPGRLDCSARSPPASSPASFSAANHPPRPNAARIPGILLGLTLTAARPLAKIWLGDQLKHWLAGHAFPAPASRLHSHPANFQFSLTAPHVSPSGSGPRRSIPPTRTRLRLLRHPPAHRLSSRLATLRHSSRRSGLTTSR